MMLADDQRQELLMRESLLDYHLGLLFTGPAIKTIALNVSTLIALSDIDDIY